MTDVETEPMPEPEVVVGLLDRFKGVKRPPEGTPALTRAELEQRLLGLAGDQVPFTVVPGTAGDLESPWTVQWKIVDAQWYEVFAKASLEKSHAILLVFDEAEHEIRALEEAWEVSWRAGVPELRLSAAKFQGRTFGPVVTKGALRGRPEGST